MAHVLETHCCGFEFWGWNHSPLHDGKCRACGAEWIGASTPEVIDAKTKLSDALRSLDGQRARNKDEI